MISLVTKAASEAKLSGSKRVTSQHLKKVIVSDAQFDYLSEIVEKIPDAPVKAGKTEGDSDEDMDGGPAKKKRGGRKKRKNSDEF